MYSDQSEVHLVLSGACRNVMSMAYIRQQHWRLVSVPFFRIFSQQNFTIQVLMKWHVASGVSGRCSQKLAFSLKADMITVAISPIFHF